MIFYIVLVCIAIGGVGALVFRHRDTLFSVGDGADQVRPTFALFMEDTTTHFARLWNDYLKVELLKVLEKNLRKVRLMTLRMEQALFRMTHRVKDISQRAQETKAENAALQADSSQNEPPSVQ